MRHRVASSQGHIIATWTKLGHCFPFGKCNYGCFRHPSDMLSVNQHTTSTSKPQIFVTPTVIHHSVAEALGPPEGPRRGIKESVELIHAVKIPPVISALFYHWLLKAI